MDKVTGQSFSNLMGVPTAMSISATADATPRGVPIEWHVRSIVAIQKFFDKVNNGSIDANSVGVFDLSSHRLFICPYLRTAWIENATGKDLPLTLFMTDGSPGFPVVEIYKDFSMLALWQAALGSDAESLKLFRIPLVDPAFQALVIGPPRYVGLQDLDSDVVYVSQCELGD